MTGVSVRTILTLSVLLMMFGLGLGITLPSGVVAPGSRQGLRQLGDNLLRVLVLVVGSLFALVALQLLVGYPRGL